MLTVNVRERDRIRERESFGTSPVHNSARQFWWRLLSYTLTMSCGPILIFSYEEKNCPAKSTGIF